MGRMTLPTNADGIEFKPGDWIMVHDTKAQVIGVSQTEVFYKTDGPITSVSAVSVRPAAPPKEAEDDD